MMQAGPRLRELVALSCLAASGCTTLREIPRDAYDAAPERKHVVIETRAGQRQEFDVAHVASDTLTGYRQRDTEGGIDEYATVVIPIDEVERMSARRIDWYRTILLGSSSLGAVIVAAVSRRKAGDSGTRTPGTPCPVEPCPP